ncbi:MAG: hypothetical protein R6U54_04690 [Candidatus Omnitrophota bacterium]
MKRKIAKKAVSLLEILISAVLLTLVVGGLTSAFFTVRAYIRHAQERSTAADLSYSHSRTLYGEVKADGGWYANGFSGINKSLPLSGSWSNIDGINYEDSNTRYEVNSVNNQDYRQAEIIVEYPD